MSQTDKTCEKEDYLYENKVNTLEILKKGKLFKVTAVKLDVKLIIED